MKGSKRLALSLAVMTAFGVTAWAAEPIEHVDLGGTNYYSGKQINRTHDQVMANVKTLNDLLEKDQGWKKVGVAAAFKQFNERKASLVALAQQIGGNPGAYLTMGIVAADNKMVDMMKNGYGLTEAEVRAVFDDPGKTYTGKQGELQEASKAGYYSRMMETDLMNGLPRAAKKLDEVIDQVNENTAGKADADAGNLTAENVTAWQAKLGDGQVADGNTGLVTGGTVKTALDAKTDADAGNLTAENVAAWQAKLGDGAIADNNTGLVTGGTVKTALADKADVDAGNLTAENVTAWQAKLGDGQVADGNTGLVTGGTVYNAVKGKVDTNLGNLTADGKTVIRDLAKDSVKVVAGTNTTVTVGTDGDATTYAVNVSNDDIKAALADDLAKKADKDSVYTKDEMNDKLAAKADKDSVYTKAETYSKTEADNLLGAKADADAGNLTPENVTAWQSALGNGQVAKGNTGLVTGGAVYTAVDAVQTDLNNFRDAQAIVDREQNRAIADVQTNVERVGAMTGALAGLKPMQYDPIAPTQVMGAISAYSGEAGYALGVAHYTKEDLMLHAGVAYDGHDEFMGNIGVTWKVGSKSDREGIPARYQAGPISSIYVMQEENENMRNQLAAQEQRIAELEAMVQQLAAK